MTDFHIETEGIEKVTAALDRFPREIQHYLGQAGDEAAKRVIFEAPGLKKYPPATAANQPPVPYYVRGRGTETARGNLGNSQRYGTQWYVETKGFYTEIGNRATYAKYLAGDEQARAMARIGWRKLVDVAQEKIGDITKVYQAWVDKLIRDLGL